MRRWLSAAVVCILLVSFAVAPCAFAELTDEEIIRCVTERFLPLTHVPRPSHHEEKIGEYLFGLAQEGGFSPVRDQAGNVIYDVPATPGMEDKPLVILQAHMDMVCAADEGVSFDPLTDPVKAVVTDETITADGTSLGADDGIGIALLLCAADGIIAHGPLRVLITVDEEDGLYGVFNMDPAVVADAKYLINLDAEQSDAVIVSTASGVLAEFTAPAETVPVSGFDTAVTVSLKGLTGGHSGMEIDKNRLSAIRAMAALLQRLSACGIRLGAASLQGGTANNAIPSSASAVLVLRGEDTDKLNEICAAWERDMKTVCAVSDPGLTLTVEPADMPDSLISDRDLDNAVSFIACIPDGAHTYSMDYAGLVESSSNLGILRLDASGLYAASLIRSSDPVRQEELIAAQAGLAENRGYGSAFTKSTDPWKFDPDSRLLAMAEDAYFDLNGEELIILAVHAGLECGTFAVMNPDLDMISMGPDLSDVHTPRETCYLTGIPKTFRLLERLLGDID